MHVTPAREAAMGIVRRKLILVALLAPIALVSAQKASARPVKVDKTPPRPVLVLRIEGGGLADELVQKLDAVARDQVKASLKGAKLLPAPVLDFEAMRVAAGCSDDGPACLSTLGTTLGAHDVVRITISGNVPKK